MRYALLDSVEQGEKLGRPIYTSDGRVLLEDGAFLTVGIISRLRRMGVDAVYLKDDMIDEVIGDIEEETVVQETTRRETIETLSVSAQYIQSGKKDFDMRGVSKTSGKIIDEILANPNNLLSLTDIRTKDNSLFVHSTNVCIMSLIIGIKLGLKRSELHELALGALFHDIGKVLGDEYSAKSERNSRDHTWKGFNFLRQKHEFSTISAHIALQHHENVDGTGSPRKISSEKIPLLAKVVAVANYYDNLLHPTNGDLPLHPHEACEKILGQTNKMFEHEVVWQFLRSIAFYPNGRQVKLSTGETGVVVGQNHGLPQRPIIRTFNMSARSRFEDIDMKELDLGNETTIFIKEIL